MWILRQRICQLEPLEHWHCNRERWQSGRILPGAAGDVYLNFDAGYQTLHHITMNRAGQTVYLCSDLTLVSSATQFLAGTFDLNGNHLTISNSATAFDFDVTTAAFAGDASSNLTINFTNVNDNVS